MSSYILGLSDESCLLQFLGHTVLPKSAPLRQAIPVLAGKGNMHPDIDCTVHEEVRWRDSLMVTDMDIEHNAIIEQLETGDIIIVQERIPEVPPHPANP